MAAVLLAALLLLRACGSASSSKTDAPSTMRECQGVPGCAWDTGRRRCCCDSPSAADVAPAPACRVTHEKQDCGYFGIQQEECEARGCCWQPVAAHVKVDTPWCFVPDPAVSTYTVMHRTDAPAGSSSTLGLVLAQPTLPGYGPDFLRLTALVEYQTPQRLHVKISPAAPPPSASTTAAPGAGGDAAAAAGEATADHRPRWEVPEWLIPRPGLLPFDRAAALYVADLPEEGKPFHLAIGRSRLPASSNDGTRAPRTADRDSAVSGGRVCFGSSEPKAGAPPGGIEMLRPIFNSSGFSLVFKEQYMEISTSLSPATQLYGLGETVQSSGQLLLPRDGRIITLWNYDIGSNNPGINLYGSHPFVLQVEPDGSSSGISLLNSNGMDVLLHETSLTYRVIGGVLDFYFFLGPGPEAVIQQYQEVIGRPAMPPLWALGFHQCRWGYQALSEVEQVVEGYEAAGLPLEVVWTDIDYMQGFRDFTFDQQRFNPQAMAAFVAKLHASGRRWVPITDCGIPHAPDDPSYVSGLEEGVFIRDVTGEPYLGQVWPGPTHYPSFLAVNRTWPWWRQQLERMWQQVPFDGMWIDMNEASNFCEGDICQLPPSAVAAGADTSPAAAGAADAASASGVAGRWTWLHSLERWPPLQRLLQLLQNAARLLHPGKPVIVSTAANQATTSAAEANCDLSCVPPPASDKLAHPPYAISNLQRQVPLGSKTLPMSAVHPGGEREYDAHNLYGLAEAAATFDALARLLNKRPFVLSRSTFPGSGRFAAKWTGDNAATWDDLRWSVSGVLTNNLWGVALAGADICGFQGDTHEELCARWIAAGAFYTFVRNHNAIYAAPQELYRWPSVAATARKALALRYRLLPYLYTSFFLAHTRGGTVARPLFFAFPGDEAARTVSEQWMLGDSILVSPVLHPDTRQLSAYFPAASWYILAPSSGDPRHPSHIRGPATAVLDVPLTDVPVHVRGGSIIPLQQPATTTAEVRRSPVTLLVTLDQQHNQQQQRPGDGNGAAASPDDGGVQLGCGLLYIDDGESLHVPPARADASLLVFFAAMAVPASLHGWLTATPAGGAPGGTAAGQPAWEACPHHQGDRERYIAVAAVAGPGAAAAAQVDVPQVAEVRVLGLPPPPPANGAGNSYYAVWANSQQLDPRKVAYDNVRSALVVTGLEGMLQLDAGFSLEWRPAGGSASQPSPRQQLMQQEV